MKTQYFHPCSTCQSSMGLRLKAAFLPHSKPHVPSPLLAPEVVSRDFIQSFTFHGRFGLATPFIEQPA